MYMLSLIHIYNMTELYFEENDIEGVGKKLESGRYEVRYATALTELDGGQKLVRFYDPSGNLIDCLLYTSRCV